ncbi:hypothetical protein HDV00_005576 [Rhizophlyctis rosea]|nr:hypothetical protein HDV00_005576 [Rhizophlyctis rosea]
MDYQYLGPATRVNGNGAAPSAAGAGAPNVGRRSPPTAERWQKAARITWDSARTTSQQILYEVGQVWCTTVALVSYYFTTYPTVRTFAIAFGALSVVPAVLFGMWVVATLCGTLFTAVMGALVVEGGLLALGLSIFIPVEVGIFFFAGFLAVLHASGEAGFGAVQSVTTRITQLLSQPITLSPPRYTPTTRTTTHTTKPRATRSHSGHSRSSSNTSPSHQSRGRRSRREPTGPDATMSEPEAYYIPGVMQNVEKLRKRERREGKGSGAESEGVVDAL